MDVAVEHRRLERLQEVERLVSVRRPPAPRPVQLEQRAMREHDHRRSGLELLQIGGEPGDLGVAELLVRVGRVVENDDVIALVVEGVVQLAEELLIRVAAVFLRVVIARHEADILDLERGDHVADLGHAAAALGGIVGRVRHVAGEGDEIRLSRQRVDRADDFLESPGGIRIDLVVLEAPMGVGQLDEEEVLGRRRRSAAVALRGRRRRDGRAEDDAKAAKTCNRKKLSTIEIAAHGLFLTRLMGCDEETGPRSGIFPAGPS